MKAPPLNLTTGNTAGSTAAPIAPAAAAIAATASKPAAGTASTGKEPGLQELSKLADRLSQKIGTTGQQIQFAVDDSSGKVIMRIIDIQTNTVLRQVPGDEALAMARAMESMQGMLIRQKA